MTTEKTTDPEQEAVNSAISVGDSQETATTESATDREQAATAALADTFEDPVDTFEDTADTLEDAAQAGCEESIAKLSDAVSALTEQVREHHARARARERVIDHLHTEVRRLKAGEHDLVLRPVVTDLQRLRGDLLHQARTLPETFSQHQTAELLESFALSVELALERCGRVPIRPAEGAAFSAREHRAVKTVPTALAEADATIAEVVADGYLDTETDRVITPARVHVYRSPAELDSTKQEENSPDA